MTRLLSFLTSLSIDYKVKTRLSMLEGDEHQHMINYSSKYIDEIFRYVINSEKIIAKPNQPNELTVSHLHSYIGWRGGLRGYIKGLGAMSAEERMAASAKGYENGIGNMSADERKAASAKGSEERMAASAKGYENGIGNMSADERKAASAKGYKNGFVASRKSMLEAGITWEEKYDVFKSYNGMPKKGTPLHNWQSTQLGNTHPSCLNAKIRKENEENEGSFVWRKRRVELADCVEQKNRANIGNAWERKFNEFKRCVGMPKKGTSLHYWQKNLLSNGASSLNAKIRKENEENEGRFVWRERRVELADCVAQKRRE
jgi:hypothetical protein